MTERLDDLVEGYDDVLTEVLAEIRRAETEAIRRSNALVVELYSRIGRVILARQRDESYGSRLIDRLALDLASRFGGQRGWSARNLRYMRSFARAWPDDEILQARLQNLTWTHHQILVDRLDDRDDRLWYAEQAVSNNWSTRVLQAQIHGQLHQRIGTAPSNFAVTMPELDSEALDQLATDPYRLDFLLVDPRAREQAIELAMVDRITEFLTHLGRGFAYLGRQWRGDGSTIGVLLVPDKDDVVVEYTLAATNMPMTVARYTYPQLPADIRSELPQASELAAILKRT
jgi:predicted nuclease of restriction endonuclease-like (RecB) superfamily